MLVGELLVPRTFERTNDSSGRMWRPEGTRTNAVLLAIKVLLVKAAEAPQNDLATVRFQHPAVAREQNFHLLNPVLTHHSENFDRKNRR